MQSEDSVFVNHIILRRNISSKVIEIVRKTPWSGKLTETGKTWIQRKFLKRNRYFLQTESFSRTSGSACQGPAPTSRLPPQNRSPAQKDLPQIANLSPNQRLFLSRRMILKPPSFLPKQNIKLPS